MDRLAPILIAHQPLLVALSGGVDSSLLLAVAAEVVGKHQVAAAITISEGVTGEEQIRARRVASQVGVRLYLAVEPLLDDPLYTANDGGRCYHCRTHMYRALRNIALANAIPWIADGTQADDQSSERPGFIARQEAGVIAPLWEAGWNKVRIRSEAKMRHLITADTPSNACLASRLPTGTPVSMELLDQVARAEAALHDAGLRQVRVRHHGDHAQVELGRNDLATLPDGRLPDTLKAAIRSTGFIEVTVAPYGGNVGDP